MPKIHDSHIAEERSVLAVRTLLAEAGALSEVIRNDYGEDLMIQTRLHQAADNFHILAQVKSRGLRKKKDGKYSIQLRTSHLRRWIGNIHSTLVFVFDSHTNRIFVVNPSNHFTLCQLSTTSNKYMSIEFSKDDLATTNSIGQAIWMCRISYYSRILSHNHNAQHETELIIGDNSILSRLVMEEGALAISFMRIIGVMDDERMTDKFLNYFNNAVENFSRTNRDESPDRPLTVHMAAMLSILGVADDNTKMGLPTNLLQSATRFCLHLLERMHPEEWQKASSMLPIVAD